MSQGNDFNVTNGDQLDSPLPLSWKLAIIDFCRVDSPHVFICTKFLNKQGMLGLGCSFAIIALLLGIILVQDRRKQKGRLLSYHDSLLFGVKFSSLLGFYFIFDFCLDLLLDMDSRRSIIAIGTITSMCILIIPVIMVSTYRWWKKGKYPNQLLKIEVTDVFQDFANLTGKAIAIGIAQLILLTIYAFAAVEDIYLTVSHTSFDSIDKTTFYVAYILSAIMQASYAVG